MDNIISQQQTAAEVDADKSPFHETVRCKSMSADGRCKQLSSDAGDITTSKDHKNAASFSKTTGCRDEPASSDPRKDSSTVTGHPWMRKDGHRSKLGEVKSVECLLQCKDCGKTFNQLRNLQLHSRTHTGIHPFVCQHCGQTFAQRRNLDVHERTHTGERPFRCGRCGRGFSRKDNLKKHTKFCGGSQ